MLFQKHLCVISTKLLVLFFHFDVGCNFMTSLQQGTVTDTLPRASINFPGMFEKAYVIESNQSTTNRMKLFSAPYVQDH